uniref:helicase-like transcription factor CHR28 n=1 Tax=Erigeron canadensis TaxID=72917 RepID=UPI001CB8C1E1|nr:helicase-like transcription factor CHR28 [Erigeron canadensis]
MMENVSGGYEWHFDRDEDDDVDDFDDDDGCDISMDLDSFFKILDEKNDNNPPLQSGLADPSISYAPYNESVTHVTANEQYQPLDDHSEASVSKTVCSSGSSDCERQAVDYGLTKVGTFPDVSSTHVDPWTAGATNVASSSYSDSREDFLLSSQYDTRDTNLENSTRGGTFSFRDDGNSDRVYFGTSKAPFSGVSGNTDLEDKPSLPSPINRNGSFYPGRHTIHNNGVLSKDKIALQQHHARPMFGMKGNLPGIASPMVNMKGNFPGSGRSINPPANNGSTNGSHFPSILPNRRNIVSIMEETSDVGSEKSCDVADRLFNESFSGVPNSISRKYNAIKREQDTRSFGHFNNIKNNPFSPSQSYVHHDMGSIGWQASLNKGAESKSAIFANMGPIGQQAAAKNVTYIDVDDPDICILEDMSVPAPRRHPHVARKTPISAAQRSAPGTPPVHMGHNNPSINENDERIVYRAALQDLSQPKSEACAPEGSLKVPLMKHQRIALSWMVQKETKNMHCFGGILADDQGLGKTISTIALMLTERSPSSSVPTAEVKKETFNLDDDDDEQKANSCVTETNGSSVETSNSSVNTKSRPAAGTLIVCPTSVLRQWNDELQNKVSSKARLSVLMYHGANRTKDPSELAKYDVVLTTYPLVQMEVPKQPLVDEDEDETERHNGYFTPAKKRKYPPKSNKVSKKRGMVFEDLVRPLAKVRWFRVVLDEAQTIKNHRTQVARACWGLKAKRRWCLSGTPIQNAIDDLYSYFRFLRYEPYAVFKSFCSTIKVPIQKSPETGYKKLQVVLKTIMLRRTKATLLDGEPIISLPPKTISLKQIDFTTEEREFYSKLEAESKAQFKAYEEAGTVEQNYVNILLMLLRLRQACDHPLLVVRGRNSSSEWMSSLEKAKKLPPEKRTYLLNCLEASSAICSICNDPSEDAVVTTCGHVFCNQCILEHLCSDESCPFSNCKAMLSTSSVFSASTLRISLRGQPSNGLDISAIVKEVKAEVKSEVLEPCSSSGSVNFKTVEAAEALDSSKIKAAVEVLQSVAKPQEIATDEKDGSVIVVREKAIVFSQWTKMLDLLEACLEDSSIKYRRLDGTMSIQDRDKAVKDFNTRPEVTVMIMSLKAASLGLNMVSACHVLLLDLWWNPTTEDQAIDRAHRIGQTRPVSVLRFTVKDTVEDRILALQQKKRSMVASAFGEDETGTSRTRLTVDDLKYLFHF